MKSCAVPLPNVYHLSFLIPVYTSLAGLFTITLMDFSTLHLDTPQKIVPASPSKACLIPFLCSFQPVSYCCNLPQLCCKIQAWCFLFFWSFLSLPQVQASSGELGSWPQWRKRGLLELKNSCCQEKANVRSLGSRWVRLGVVVRRIWQTPLSVHLVLLCLTSLHLKREEVSLLRMLRRKFQSGVYVCISLSLCTSYFLEARKAKIFFFSLLFFKRPGLVGKYRYKCFSWNLQSVIIEVWTGSIWEFGRKI